MDAIDGQEVQFPVVMPASLWQESGRYDSIGKEMARFQDRNGTPLVLGMTHEEAAVQLVREYGNSYLKYPFMVYQIQTKFRDEARPRAGLIRVREFTMKDAYSFHTSQSDLDAYYEQCHRAYERIYARVGLPEVISVASDSGMMGGSVSHEFMLLTPIGEDSIAICKECGYRANVEAAACITPITGKNRFRRLDPAAHARACHTIEEVCEFLHCDKKDFLQSSGVPENLLTMAMLFCSSAVIWKCNETKLTRYLGEEIYPAVITEESGLQRRVHWPCQSKG